MAQFTHLLGSIYPLPEASWSKTLFSSHIKFRFFFCSFLGAGGTFSLTVYHPVCVKVFPSSPSRELFLCSSVREYEWLELTYGHGATPVHRAYFTQCWGADQEPDGRCGLNSRQQDEAWFYLSEKKHCVVTGVILEGSVLALYLWRLKRLHRSDCSESTRAWSKSSLITPACSLAKLSSRTNPVASS